MLYITIKLDTMGIFDIECEITEEILQDFGFEKEMSSPYNLWHIKAKNTKSHMTIRYIFNNPKKKNLLEIVKHKFRGPHSTRSVIFNKVVTDVFGLKTCIHECL